MKTPTLPVPETSIGLRLSAELRARLEQRAKAAHRTLSGEVRHILEQHLREGRS
jgi:predicted DNA-binding protein